MGGRRRRQDGPAPAPQQYEVAPGPPRGFGDLGDAGEAYDAAPGAGSPYTGYEAAPGYGHAGGSGGGYGAPGPDDPQGYAGAPYGGAAPHDDHDGYAGDAHGGAAWTDPDAHGSGDTGTWDDYAAGDHGGADHDDHGAGARAAGGLAARATGDAPGRRASVPAPRGAGDDAAGDRGTPARLRVPIWHPPGPLSAVLTTALAALLAVTALAGGPVPLAGVAVLQVVTAAGWFRLNGMWPARQGIALAVLAGFAALVAVETAGANALRVVPGVLAGALLLVLVQQLSRRDGRAELMPALTVTASAVLVTVLDVGYVFAADLSRPGAGAGAVTVSGAAAVAAAVLLASAPLPAAAGAVAGFAAGTAVGAGAGVALGLGTGAAALAAGAAVAGLAGRAVSGYDHPSRFVHMTAGVALPLALAAPVVYLLGRVVVG